MSVEAMALALHHSRSSGAAKLVLIGIANHEGDGGAWPAVSTLAKYAGMTGTPESNARAVRRILGKLIELGEITIERQAGGTKDMPDFERPNLYHITLACPADCDGTTKHKVPTKKTPGLRNPPAPGSTTRDPRVKQPAKPSTQPPAQPSSSGPSDSGPAQPSADRASSTAEGLINGEWTQKQWARMKEDADRLREICAEIGEERPASVFWTLLREHNVKHPDAFMADKVEKGEWDGFVARHGLNEYTSTGKAA